jgi:hypothetical protein
MPTANSQPQRGGAPGVQLLAGPAGCGPVAGCLRGQCVVLDGPEGLGNSLVQRDLLPGQQPGSHRLGQQRMPQPMLPKGGNGQQSGPCQIAHGRSYRRWI